MTNKICVYTCITGDYDHLHEIEHPEKGIDYYCFTNNKNLQSKTWNIIQIKNGDLDNCRLARKIKILGHKTVNQYDIAVWSDADIIWQQSITKFIKEYFKDTNFSIFKHHARNSIYDEAIVCLKLRKDSKDIIQKTLSFYQTTDYPDDNGLCESTVFIKNPKDPLVQETSKIWFDIVKDYSRRDQLSFNYAAWKTHLPFSYIPLIVWDNPWFYPAKHTPTNDNTTCHVYYGNPDESFEFNKYQIYSYQIKNNIYSFHTTIPNDTSEIELNPTNIIGAEYSDIIIKPTPHHFDVHGAVTINNQKSFFCNDHGTIRAYADFKKGQKLSFSIKMQDPTYSTLNKIIEYQWSHNSDIITNKLTTKIQSLENANTQLQNTNTKLQNDYSSLRQELTTLQADYQRLIHSKGWRTLEHLRKVVSPLRRK